MRAPGLTLLIVPLAVLFVLFSNPFIAAQKGGDDASPEDAAPETISVPGRVTKIEPIEATGEEGKDGSTPEGASGNGRVEVSVRTSLGTVRFQAPGDRAIVRHRRTTLKDVSEGSRLRVLCRKQKEGRHPETHQEIEAQYINIQSIVVAPEDFTPPEQPDDSRFTWFSGELTLEKGQFRLDGILVVSGGDRPVIQISSGTVADLRKGVAVHVKGTIVEKKRKEISLDLDGVIVLASGIPSEDYSHVLPR